MIKIIVDRMTSAQVRLVHLKPEAALHIHLVKRYARSPGSISIVTYPCPSMLGRKCVHCSAGIIHITSRLAFEHLCDEHLRNTHREIREVDMQCVDIAAVLAPTRRYGEGEPIPKNLYEEDGSLCWSTESSAAYLLYSISLIIIFSQLTILRWFHIE